MGGGGGVRASRFLRGLGVRASGFAGLLGEVRALAPSRYAAVAKLAGLGP